MGARARACACAATAIAIAIDVEVKSQGVRESENACGERGLQVRLHGRLLVLMLVRMRAQRWRSALGPSRMGSARARTARGLCKGECECESESVYVYVYVYVCVCGDGGQRRRKMARRTPTTNSAPA